MIWIVQSKDNLMIFGVFDSLEKAERYSNGSEGVAVNAYQVI